jgi:hypothetical protein
MARVKALIVALALGGTAGGCGRPAVSEETTMPEPVADAVVVRVVNNSFADIDVYAVSHAGARLRLGTVTATSNTNFVLDPSYFPAGELRLMATPIGGNERASSGLLNVTAGETVEFNISQRLRDSSATVR